MSGYSNSDKVCGRNDHHWVFTEKIPPNDLHPNYWYRCSKCGKEACKESPSSPMVWHPGGARV
jgi:hypothetical protein